MATPRACRGGSEVTKQRRAETCRVVPNGVVCYGGSAMPYDILIRGGVLFDAKGLAVAPGFIDIKTHSDFTLPINPKAESLLREGVTTEIIGHCGFSVARVLA